TSSASSAAPADRSQPHAPRAGSLPKGILLSARAGGASAGEPAGGGPDGRYPAAGWPDGQLSGRQPRATTSSISTGASSGSALTPTALRACIPASPKIS